MDDSGQRTKNRKDHRVYLTPSAVEALEQVPQVEDEPFVFVGYRGKRQMVGINTAVFAGVRRRRNRGTRCAIPWRRGSAR